MVRPDKYLWEIPEGVLCLWGFFINDLEGLPAGAGQSKSGGGLVRPDKHKTKLPKRRLFAFLADLTYDLEGLATGAGQSKSRGGLVNVPSYLRSVRIYSYHQNQHEILVIIDCEACFIDFSLYFIDFTLFFIDFDGFFIN
ncbi:hypothetical protein QTG56_13105 [Rossellomorea sp. AcN35-11]|nr:hypothetical protein [Rossellomorea aquimaris]WJV28084.1 hypothetical protein QTG56_13105 [Rossellomorea sp. AcN35-11]